MRISDWSSDVCSSDLGRVDQQQLAFGEGRDAQQPVARGLRTVGDDADLGPDQGVDQGGLADVGAADDGDVAGAVWGGIHAGIVWRSEERRVGKECVSTFEYRCTRYL